MSVLLFFVSILSQAFADTHITCNYSYFGAPMAKVSLDLNADNLPSSSALVEMQGSAHHESVTRDTLSAEQFLHVWLSMESPDRAVEMIIYRQPKASGQSELINHNVPVGQEIWGGCSPFNM